MNPAQVIVLGLGNILCGDDGFGVHAALRLQEDYNFPESCQIIDGGTQGQLLYGIVEEADRLLLIDAADFNLPPGSLSQHEAEEIPKWLGQAKLSAHQGSFAEILALAELKNVLPLEIKLIAFQPEIVEFGQPLSAQGRAKIPDAIRLTLISLDMWGIKPQPANNPVSGACQELRSAFS